MTAFFMLSGYVLFQNYSYKNIIELPNFKEYLLKRIIGIIPLYYFASLLYIIINSIAYKLGVTSYSIINDVILAPIEILGIQSNFHTLFDYSHNGGTWFISCLLMCYIIFPLFQEIFKQITCKTKIFSIALIGFILLYSPYIANKFQTIDLYANPFFRILEFSIGVLLASMKTQLDLNSSVVRYVYNWKIAIVVYFLLILGVSIAVIHGLYLSLITLPCFILLLISLAGVESNFLSVAKPIRYSSELSYAFFLAQLYSNKICKFLVLKFNITNNTLIILLGWTMCIVIAISLHELFEKPIKKYLKGKCLKL